MSAVSTMPEVSMIARDRVKTPALILDLEAMESNIAAMTDRARRLGVGLRAHAKSHKCVEIARRLAAAGALGPGCATIAEAEAMAAGGIAGILITSPMATDHALDRVRRMLLRGADVMLTADHPANVDALADLARAAGRRLPVIVEFDMGVGRTGCLEAPDAIALAQRISGHASLRFAGVQAYWGNLQQIMPLSEREARVAVQAARLKVLIDALTAAGLKPEIVTGAGTGTHWIDGQSGLFTEIQPGSFLFLDSCYDKVEFSAEPSPFRPSLFVAASVVSANRPGRVIVNAGWKAFATDSGNPVPMRGAPTEATYHYMGDEHGAVDFTLGSAPALGSVIELLVSHCDPTVNLHAAYRVVRDEAVVDEWPITARGY
jgi:D-serine deaminase-like pyridoxal phosphate-dependent protein